MVPRMCLLAICLSWWASAARADDLAARLEHEFSRLASEDTAERDAAVEAIAREGTAALEAVKSRIATEKDPEVLGRLNNAWRKIEKRALGARSWAAVWSVQPVADTICGVRLSPDGKHAATIGNDGCLHLIDVGARRVTRTIENVAVDWQNDFIFSADGALLICTTEDCDTVRLRAWRTKDGTEVGPIEEAGIPAYFDPRLYRGPDGLALLVSPRHGNGAAWIRSIRDGSGVSGDAGPGNTHSLSSDGRFLSQLLSTSDVDAPEEATRTIEVRDLASGKLLRKVRLTLEGSETAAFSFSPDGLLAAGMSGGHLQVVSLAGGGEPLEWDAAAVALAWIPEGLVTARADGTLDWWRDGKRVKSLETKVPWVWRLEPVAGALAVVDAENRLRCLVARSGEEVLDRIEGPCEEPSRLGDTFAVKTEKGTLIYEGGRCVATLTEPDPGVVSNFRPWSCRAGVLIYHCRDRALLKTLDGSRTEWELPPHGAVVERLEWAREGIAAIYGDGRVAVLDPAGGKTLRTGRNDEFWISPGRCVRLASVEPDAKAGPDLAFAEGADAVAIRDPGGWRVKLAIDGKSVRLVPEGPSEDMRPLWALSANGRFLAAVTEVNFITLWEIATRVRLARHELLKEDVVVQIAVVGDAPIVFAHVQGPTGSRLRAVNSKGAVVAEVPWPELKGGARTLFTDRLAAHVDDDAREGACLVIANLQAPDPLHRIELEDLYFDQEPRIHAAPSGDRVLVEGRLHGVLYASAGEGLISVIGNFPNRVEQVGGFLEGAHPVVVSPQGLRLIYGPTGEEVLLDSGIRGSALAVSPDGKRIAVANGGRIAVLELH